METYRISKAWHLGHEVAESIHYLIKLLPAEDANLPGLMRRYSTTIPHLIAASISKKSKVEKLKCYTQARQAAIDLLEQMDKARNQKVIEENYYQEQAAKIIETQKQLTHVIRNAKKDLETAE